MDFLQTRKDEVEVLATIAASSTAPLSKSAVETMIKTGNPRITLVRKEGSHAPGNQRQSNVWDSFMIVCLDGKCLDYVQCSQCETLLSWKQGNTSTLTRHSSSCKSGQSTKGIQMKLEQFQKKTMPINAIKELNNTITIGLAKDLKPLGMVKGAGFLYIAQELINVGARYGFQNAKALLNHPSTMKRNLPNIVAKKKEEIFDSLKTAPSYPKLAFTTDMWTDAYKHRHFLSLSVHYVDKDFKSQCYLLGVHEFPDVDKTTDNIRLECKNILRGALQGNVNELDAVVDTIISNSIAVTDGGSNFINVFPTRIPCMCHKLNNVMHWIFNEKQPKHDTEVPPKKKFIFSQNCPDLSASVTGIKNFVTYFKRSGLNYKLSQTLKQENVTRWNSKLIMLQSYSKVSEEVKKILIQKNEVVRLLGINDGAVDNLISFLKPFKTCTDVWSSEKEPTLFNVVLEVRRLHQHIEIQEDDSVEIKKLKEQTKVCVEEYLKFDDIHLIATMLHPQYKRLKFIDTTTRTRVVARLKEMVDQVSLDEPGNPRIKDASASQPEVKRSRYDEFADSDSSDMEEPGHRHEVDVYLELKIKKDINMTILGFWKDVRNLPRLRKVALAISAVPASQTTDERVFSSTGATLSPRRTELKGATVSDLTYVHKNFSV